MEEVMLSKVPQAKREWFKAQDRFIARYVECKNKRPERLYFPPGFSKYEGMTYQGIPIVSARV